MLAPRDALAPEYSPADLSQTFKPNGSTDPDDPDYVKDRDEQFANWKLDVGGLIDNPIKLSLADLRDLPSRTQITRHDCVEGWSCIGKWKGALLGPISETAGLKPSARYIAFYCADTLEQTLDGTGQYYETIDLVDAFHPQTILAYEMNEEPLPVAHGAPLRLRVERQLGYKMAKYVMRIEAIEPSATSAGATAAFGKIAATSGTRGSEATFDDFHGPWCGGCFTAPKRTDGLVADFHVIFRPGRGIAPR